MSSAQSITVLMTGGGAPGAAGILRCLHREPTFRVIAADARAEVVGRYLAEGFFTIPAAGDPGFTDAVLALCIREKVNVLLPLVTKELIPLAQRAADFQKAGVWLPISPASSLEIANNKSRLYQFLEWRGVPVPTYRVVETVDQFRTALAELGSPAKSVCFKPSVSNGSRGFRVVTEEFSESDLLFNHKPGHTFLRPGDALRILSAASFPELLVSEYLPGEEYSVDCLANHGETILAVPRLRRRMTVGISAEGEFVKEESIIRYCTSIIRELQLHGNVGIQVKRSAAGECLVLEINPRVQGTISAGLGAGINLPVLAIKQEMGMMLPPEALSVKWGTRFIRYWDEVFF